MGGKEEACVVRASGEWVNVFSRAGLEEGSLRLPERTLPSRIPFPLPSQKERVRRAPLPPPPIVTCAMNHGPERNESVVPFWPECHAMAVSLTASW